MFKALARVEALREQMSCAAACGKVEPQTLAGGVESNCAADER
jgi:hypothetical protein